MKEAWMRIGEICKERREKVGRMWKGIENSLLGEGGIWMTWELAEEAEGAGGLTEGPQDDLEQHLYIILNSDSLLVREKMQ